jgi:hypothetical protein
MENIEKVIGYIYIYNGNKYASFDSQRVNVLSFQCQLALKEINLSSGPGEHLNSGGRYG